MSYVKDREAELERQGLSEGPNTPRPTSRPAPLSPEDQAFAIGYGADRARLAAEAPEVAGRVQAHDVQTLQHFLESIDPHLRALGYYDTYQLWGDAGHQKALVKLSEVFNDPSVKQKFLRPDGDYNYPEVARFVMSDVAPAVAKELGFNPAPTVDDYIRDRQEWIAKRRGYGYQGNEMSASMNQ